MGNRFWTGLSIRTKIMLGYVFLILSVSVFIYTYYPSKQKQQAINAIHFKIKSITNMMSTGVGIGMGELDLVAISEVLNWAKEDNSLAYIIVLDDGGQEIMSYNPSNMPLDKKELMRHVEASFEKNRVLHNRDILSYQEQVFGTLLTGYSLKELDESIEDQQRATLFLCLGIFLSGLLISVIISDKITTNIRKLGNAVKVISTGFTDVQVDIKSNDEIGKLADAFNEMTTNLRLSHDEIVTSKQYTENIIRSMLDSLFVLDKEYNVVSMNHAANEMLGYTEKELIGKKFDYIMDVPANLEVLMNELQNSGRLQNHESVFIAKSGERIIVLFSAAVIIDNKWNEQGIVCVAQNITERKKAEQKLKDYSSKLEKSNKELDQFAYVVSHDLKAPLRAIFKLSQWIQEDIEEHLSEENKQQMELLRGRVYRLEALINGLLAYGKINKTLDETEQVNVKQLLDDAIDLLSPPSEFKISIQEGMPTLQTQRVRLHQVFSNLIENAIRHNDKEEGRIHISFTEMENFYEFSIEDNGPGIEPQFHEKIFVIFQTLEARDKVESTGIGLAIIKKIIEEQGGRIGIVSEKGNGSKFIFTWPK